MLEIIYLRSYRLSANKIARTGWAITTANAFAMYKLNEEQRVSFLY